MQYYPYPPEWFKKSSVDLLTALEDYRDSLLYWAEDWWDDFFEDELRSVWKMTLYAGTAALVLMILLFLETRSSQTTKVVSLEKDEIKQSEPQPAEKPRKPFDPFEEFKLEPEQEEISAVPEKPFPTPEPPFVPPAMQPELITESTNTDLLPDFQHSEKPALSTAASQFVSPVKGKVLLTDRWHRFEPKNQFHISPQHSVSWFETPAAQLVKEPTHAATAVSPSELPKRSADLTVRKKMPENVTAGSALNYELIVKNNDSVVHNNIVLEEVVSDHQCVTNVIPAAFADQGKLRWVIDSLQPDEERHFKISCIASRNSPVLQTETRLNFLYSLASSTTVFVPDVVVSLTLPVAVDQSKDFLVQIEIANHSEKVFAESDLKIELLQGVLAEKSKQIVRKVKIPSPGESIVLPVKLTAAQAGKGVIQAELDLGETLMVPVTAYTTIRPVNEPTSRDAVVKKVMPHLAKSAEQKQWRSSP